MASADYCLCDWCEGKVFYDADTEVPEGTVVLHQGCALPWAKFAVLDEPRPENDS